MDTMSTMAVPPATPPTSASWHAITAWQARAEAPPAWEPGPEAVDPLAAALDAAGEGMRHAGD